MLREKVIVGFMFLSLVLQGQEFNKWIVDTDTGMTISGLAGNDSVLLMAPRHFPLFSVKMDGEVYVTSDAKAVSEDTVVRFTFHNGVTGRYMPVKQQNRIEVLVELVNTTPDTVMVENFVPFGEGTDHPYLTAGGPPGLARARLYRPGLGPIGVILPDNAWEMGYGDIPISDSLHLAAIARRQKVINGMGRRYLSLLPPKASVLYKMYALPFQGPWQQGLEKMFHEHYLFDLDSFDEALYNREDLKWIRDKYIIVLQMAWDRQFYDYKAQKYNFFSFLEEGKKYFGGYDVFGIWPTWPRLGLDQRNQWDLYRDLPLGLPKLKEFSQYARSNDTRFFISYNPWDKDTQGGNHLSDMAGLIREMDADGVVLDTRGSSSYALQRAADSVRKGVIMYSEGMAVPKDMPGIVAGRVHNAIYFSPPLNLNKVIKPEFSIFRVCELNGNTIHREIATSFFNGYGVELNIFAPGRADWKKEAYAFMGRTMRILRENSAAFHNDKWVPLIETEKDSIWINRWQDQKKNLYTLLSFTPHGFEGPLFQADTASGYHFVSLWTHEEIQPVTYKGKPYISMYIPGYPASYKNTRKEGEVECVARFPEFLKASFRGDTLIAHAAQGDRILVWKGDPSYQNQPITFSGRDVRWLVRKNTADFEGKYVVQCFSANKLMDEKILRLTPGKPYLITKKVSTKKVSVKPPNMVLIPGGSFMFSVSNPDQFIAYPDYTKPVEVTLEPFYMDRYPVTNEDFYDFILSTNYKPKDPTNFLKNWKNGKYPPGQDDYPVVWVSLEDARAYAAWAKKRLPTEQEWQYAAQGTDGRLWPWGNDFLNTRCNNGFNRPTPVSAFSKGKSPFKVEDMVGNVWQLTNDVYFNGSYYFVIIRGGSYFNPTSSQWYIKGGPQRLDKTQMLLLVSPGFDRSATIGFRCVKDAVPKK